MCKNISKFGENDSNNGRTVLLLSYEQRKTRDTTTAAYTLQLTILDITNVFPEQPYLTQLNKNVKI